MRYKNRRYVANEVNAPAFKGIGPEILTFIKTSSVDSTVDELVEHLYAGYEVNKAELRRDVYRFLDECLEQEVLTNIDQVKECDRVIKNIHDIQKSLPEVQLSNFGFCAKVGDNLSPGCQSCGQGKWAVFYACPKCNLNCRFCPFTTETLKSCQNYYEDCANCESIHFAGTLFHSFRDLKLQFDLLKDQYSAFAWIGGEVLQPHVFKKIVPMISYFHKAYPSYHQWVYTNGVFATKERMRTLFAAGIREIRFNLAAVNFDKKVIRAMKDAKAIFPYVCLEMPMLKDSYAGLLSNIKEILATGLDQMNLSEYIVGKNHLIKGGKLEKEGKLYNFKGYMTSPVASRQYTYKIIRKAVAEKWPVVINDCSNEYKYYKLSARAQRRIKIFTGQKPYWNNNYCLSEVDDWNEKLA